MRCGDSKDFSLLLMVGHITWRALTSGSGMAWMLVDLRGVLLIAMKNHVREPSTLYSKFLL